MFRARTGGVSHPPWSSRSVPCYPNSIRVHPCEPVSVGRQSRVAAKPGSGEAGRRQAPRKATRQQAPRSATRAINGAPEVRPLAAGAEIPSPQVEACPTTHGLRAVPPVVLGGLKNNSFSQQRICRPGGGHNLYSGRRTAPTGAETPTTCQARSAA
jgi:hypothetical protein